MDPTSPAAGAAPFSPTTHPPQPVNTQRDKEVSGVAAAAIGGGATARASDSGALVHARTGGAQPQFVVTKGAIGAVSEALTSQMVERGWTQDQLDGVVTGKMYIDMAACQLVALNVVYESMSGQITQMSEALAVQAKGNAEMLQLEQKKSGYEVGAAVIESQMDVEKQALFEQAVADVKQQRRFTEAEATAAARHDALQAKLDASEARADALQAQLTKMADEAKTAQEKMAVQLGNAVKQMQEGSEAKRRAQAVQMMLSGAQLLPMGFFLEFGVAACGTAAYQVVSSDTAYGAISSCLGGMASLFGAGGGAVASAPVQQGPPQPRGMGEGDERSQQALQSKDKKV